MAGILNAHVVAIRLLLFSVLGHIQATSQSIGATYVRWGRTTCDGRYTELVYPGVVAGSNYKHAGSGANYLCLPMAPTWGTHDYKRNSYAAYMYGTEYQLGSDSDFPFDSSNAHYLRNDNVPCAVCRVSRRSTVLMIPARVDCFSGWTEEYKGYLMSARYNHHRSEYICIDENAEEDYNGEANDDGALLYPVEAVCGSLPCPPYANGKELACVVCSK